LKSDVENSHSNSEMNMDKPFPSLRIYIAIREDSNNTSTIELDKFGPISLIETNGMHTFLEKNEKKMISTIIQK
jgi:hypothetical protein